MTKYRKRELEDVVVHALSTMPVVVVTGLRQVGKSTLLLNEKSLRKRKYVTLDDFAQLQAAREAPESFIKQQTPITIDEVQRCPELLFAIKRSVDQDRSPGRFLLSGSANFSLLKGISETLAGRAIYLTLSPFSLRELRRHSSKRPFLLEFIKSPALPASHSGTTSRIEYADVLMGGMPPVCLKQSKDPLLWFQGYEQTYLERDIRALSQVADLISFRNLFKLAAFRTGQILKISELARDAKLNVATTSRYLNLLETSFVVQRIFPYLGNRASRLIKSPKIYFSDSGLACYLTGVEDLDSTQNMALKGALIETFIAQNLMAILGAHMPRSRLYFWSIQGRHEVDFVIDIGHDVLAVEVKASTHWQARDLAGLRAFLKSTPHCRAAILAYNGTHSVRLGERLWALPLRLLLS